tara:strand:- start:39 stop:1220 length:1182 start_codon:yes stop_codon:yes gene_type:complete
MANLAKKHIQGTLSGPSYQATTELFFNKVFGDKKTYGHDFATDKGVVISESISVKYSDGTTIKYNDVSQKQKYLSSARGAVSAELHGKLKGNKNKITLKHTQLFKTEEFGGKPVGGKKESRGTVFEKDFTSRLQECINGEVCVGKYHKPAGYLIEQLETLNGAITKIENVGGQNASRPMEVAGKQIYIAPRAHIMHGPVLTDVTVHHVGKKSFLSLKYGGTLTFMNPGSKSLFSDGDIRDYNINTLKGKALLNMFGIDHIMFCDVFNAFGTTAQSNKNKKLSGPSASADVPRIKEFVKTAMGSNYWMVHAQSSGEMIDMWWMNPEDVKGDYSSVNNVNILYGGNTGTGKRVDVSFSNKNFEFKLNIRNKSGGVYPTNIMLDYKTLSIPTKVTL